MGDPWVQASNYIKSTKNALCVGLGQKYKSVSMFLCVRALGLFQKNTKCEEKAFVWEALGPGKKTTTIKNVVGHVPPNLQWVTKKAIF